MTRRCVSSIIALQILALTLLTAGPLAASPITSITNLNNFRDTRSLNDLGIGQGDLIQFGASVVPNGAAGTTMEASQGSTTRPAATCVGLADSPNFCAKTVAFSDALRGAWTLTFRNGTDSRVAATPDLSLLPPVPSPAVPFPVSVTITGAGLQPTISFVVPDDFNPDAVRFQIFDKDDRLSNGAANIIHSEGAPGSTRSFTAPTVLSTGRTLRIGGNYALNIQLIDTRRDDIPFTNANSQILRRSNSFFSFTPRTDSVDAFLPTVGPDGVYRFHIADVQAGAVVFVDPLVAVGYDYATGAGDPNFESVLLPDVGDGAFTVHFVFNNAPVEQTVLAGEQFFFPSGGVNAFRVDGIEVFAHLDPANVTAFVTGLSFVSDGAFTGTMTPITQETGFLTALSAAEVWTGLKNSDDVGTNLDLKAEVYAGGTLIGSGQLNGVGGGSSGFNNARHSSIPLSLVVPPVDVSSDTVLSLKLSARITCSGRTHASGTARLWFNDQQAASRFGAAIDGVSSDYFLQSAFALGLAQGSGPKTTIDSFLDSKAPCSGEGGRPFTPFGTWSINIALP